MLRTRLVTALLALAAIPAFAQNQAAYQQTLATLDRHQSAEWLTIEPHLPSPSTGSVADLITAADVLRARRMPEDAVTYYNYALTRGADQAVIMKRLGITELELHNNPLAEISFRRAIQLKPKDFENWNNLGAVQSVTGDYHGSIQSYRKALKLNRKSAVTHSNLGTAYLELKDYESAHGEFQAARKLDPGIFERDGSGGVQAQLLSPTDRGRYCFEMARLAAAAQDEPDMLHWLAQASEAGMDIRLEMTKDAHFLRYNKDDRIALLVTNAKSLRSRQLAAATPAPALPPE